MMHGLKRCQSPAFIPAVVCVLLAAGAALPASAFEQGLAYRGRLAAIHANRISAYTPIPMVFRIYASAERGAVLWARKHSVAMESDGSFSVTLRDDAGTLVAGAKYESLVDALGAAPDPWIGLTPGSSTDGDASLEFKPRQRLSPVPYAATAVLARRSDALSVDTVTSETLDTESVSAACVTVREDATGLGSTDRSLRLSVVGRDNVLRVDKGRLTLTRFVPPQSTLAACGAASVTNSGASAQLAICTGFAAESDVKSVDSVIILPGETLTLGNGGKVNMTQKFGEGK